MKIYALFTSLLVISSNVMAKDTVEPQIVEQLVQKAKENDNWKVAFVTGKQEQVVFMTVSPLTNPDNEVGMETHPFDQIILIVEGKGEASVNGKTSYVQEGDMLFIPLGTEHNVINLNPDQPLKLISFYSDTDIPKGSVYKMKSDEIKELSLYSLTGH